MEKKEICRNTHLWNLRTQYEISEGLFCKKIKHQEIFYLFLFLLLFCACSSPNVLDLYKNSRKDAKIIMQIISHEKKSSENREYEISNVGDMIDTYSYTLSTTNAAQWDMYISDFDNVVVAACKMTYRGEAYFMYFFGDGSGGIALADEVLHGKIIGTKRERQSQLP